MKMDRKDISLVCNESSDLSLREVACLSEDLWYVLFMIWHMNDSYTSTGWQNCLFCSINHPDDHMTD